MRRYERHAPPCHADVGCFICEATPYIGPPPTCEWHVPLCNRGNGCWMCEEAPYEVKKKYGWFPNPLGSPKKFTPPSSPQKSTKPMEPSCSVAAQAPLSQSDAESPQETPESKQWYSYAFVVPCPGEGLGGTGEYCATNNLCNLCLLCKVCGHCSTSCAEYIDMVQYTSGSSSMTQSVSKQFQLE